MYQEKFFFLCHIPLSAAGPQDVEILQKAETTNEFPELFEKYEDLRTHAFNEDGLFSIIRADDLHLIVRTRSEESAKETAFEEGRANLITNLQHKVMQEKDKNAVSILREVHGIEMELS